MRSGDSVGKRADEGRARGQVGERGEPGASTSECCARARPSCTPFRGVESAGNEGGVARSVGREWKRSLLLRLRCVESARAVCWLGNGGALGEDLQGTGRLEAREGVRDAGG